MAASSPNPTEKTLLITGATGKQGGAVIRALLSRSTPTTPLHIIALTRNPTSPSAQRLLSLVPHPANSNVTLTLHRGDLNDCPAIFSTLPAIHGIFSVQLPRLGLGGADVAAEEKQGKDLIDAAIQHGHVERFVYSSVDRGGRERSDNDGTYVPHFRSKYNIEMYLKERIAASTAGEGEGGKKNKKQKMSWTILRTVAFMENLTDDFFGRVFGTIWRGLGSKTIQLISTRDIGWFAAEALVGGEETGYSRDQAISIAGDELDFEAANKVYREVMGRDIPTTSSLVVKPLRWMAKDLDLMFRWLQENSCGAEIGQCKKKNKDMQDFAAWLRENKVAS